MNNYKFLGVCLVVAALLLSVSIIYAKPSRRIGRYQFHASAPAEVVWILDTTTGVSHPVTAKSAQESTTESD